MLNIKIIVYLLLILHIKLINQQTENVVHEQKMIFEYTKYW